MTSTFPTNLVGPQGRLQTIRAWRQFAAMPNCHARNTAYWGCVARLRELGYQFWQARRRLESAAAW